MLSFKEFALLENNLLDIAKRPEYYAILAKRANSMIYDASKQIKTLVKPVFVKIINAHQDKIVGKYGKKLNPTYNVGLTGFGYEKGVGDFHFSKKLGVMRFPISFFEDIYMAEDDRKRYIGAIMDDINKELPTIQKKIQSVLNNNFFALLKKKGISPKVTFGKLNPKALGGGGYIEFQLFKDLDEMYKFLSAFATPAEWKEFWKKQMEDNLSKQPSKQPSRNAFTAYRDKVVPPGGSME